MQSSARAYKRCQPHLGTFVEMTLRLAAPDHAATAAAACQAAFARIAAGERRLSYHLADSEVSAYNRLLVGETLTVSPDLLAVLSFAAELGRRSRGVFQVAVAAPLVEWGELPGAVSTFIDWAALGEPAFATEGSQVRRLSPAPLDLGGIAKGYLVDAAVATLVEHLAADTSGLVNAGGDLRAFGPETFAVTVRAEAEVSAVGYELPLRQAALATSSVRRHGAYSAHVDIHRRTALVTPQTAVVQASSCMVADALTKVVLLGSETLAAEVCDHFRAVTGRLTCD